MLLYWITKIHVFSSIYIAALCIPVHVNNVHTRKNQNREFKQHKKRNWKVAENVYNTEKNLLAYNKSLTIKIIKQTISATNLPGNRSFSIRKFRIDQNTMNLVKIRARERIMLTLCERKKNLKAVVVATYCLHFVRGSSNKGNLVYGNPHRYPW